MIELRRADERGRTRLHWLDSRHTFSFGGYFDPAHMGVSALRVINQDRVIAGAGFPAHSHRDMEIITYVTRGAIEHRDSMGNVEVLPAGEYQLMSAGTGVTHSEYNPSPTEPLEFLQIWVQPDRKGIAPGYQQRRFPRRAGLQLIASPDAREGSLLLHQDASLYQFTAPDAREASHDIGPGRTLYVHVVSGTLALHGETLAAGDGGAVRGAGAAVLAGAPGCEALVFDLP